MNITIPETTITVQPEIVHTGTEVQNVIVTDDLMTYASVSFTFGGKSFSEILWDENTTPSYEEVGVWENDDVVARIVEILNQ